MAKHTEGPWEWVDSPAWGYSTLWNASTRQEVLVPGGRNEADSPEVWMGEEMSDADKALIAAAPDLLEACKRALEMLESVEAKTIAGDEGCLWGVEILRAALSKAES